MKTTARDPFWVTRNQVGRVRDALRSRRIDDAPRPPGPRGQPFVEVLREFKADPLGYLQQLANEYGDVYRVPLPLYDVVVVNHPEHLRHIMNFREGEYSMLGPAGWIRSVLGASMAMLEGDQFRKRRRLLTPMMGRGQLSKIATVVEEEFADRLQRWGSRRRGR